MEGEENRDKRMSCTVNLLVNCYNYPWKQIVGVGGRKDINKCHLYNILLFSYVLELLQK